jgi:hypothetical protein
MSTRSCLELDENVHNSFSGTVMKMLDKNTLSYVVLSKNGPI